MAVGLVEFNFHEAENHRGREYLNKTVERGYFHVNCFSFEKRWKCRFMLFNFLIVIFYVFITQNC